MYHRQNLNCSLALIAERRDIFCRVVSGLGFRICFTAAVSPEFQFRALYSIPRQTRMFHCPNNLSIASGCPDSGVIIIPNQHISQAPILNSWVSQKDSRANASRSLIEFRPWFFFQWSLYFKNESGHAMESPLHRKRIGTCNGLAICSQPQHSSNICPYHTWVELFFGFFLSPRATALHHNFQQPLNANAEDDLIDDALLVTMAIYLDHCYYSVIFRVWAGDRGPLEPY